MKIKLVILVALGIISTVWAGLQDSPGNRFRSIPTTQFTSTWIVQISDLELDLDLDSDDHPADQLADKYGFVNVGKVGNLIDYFEFKLLPESGDKELNRRSINQLSVADENQYLTKALQNEPNVGFVQQQKRKQQFKKEFMYPTDPRFSAQWSLVNTGQNGVNKGLDLNIEPVWLQGFNGSRIVVSIMDDGLEITHPDLSPNYLDLASWDFVDSDPDPTPTKYYGDEPDRHGTSCAGEIAMAKDNNKCGVGVAYDTSIGCLKFDMSDSSDSVEANPLGYKNDLIQVYSNSWGPSDAGYIVDGPGPLLKQTFETAVQTGRYGKGSIFVWAAGNGGWNFDSCAADGYASSIYTIGVGSADQTGGEASYDEPCPGKIAVTYSFNSRTFSEFGLFDPYDQISTTTLNGKCTDDFTGTSASAPLVSGVIALALQANPDLTWRDVQYLLVYTSNPDELVDGDWTVNGGRLKVSHKFGFGAVDAEALVTRARRWTTVPAQIQNSVYGDHVSGTVYQHLPLSVRFTVTSANADVNFLEHVILSATLNVRGYANSYGIDDLKAFITDSTTEDDYEMWLQDPHPRRGDIMIELTSPQGTTSTLLPYRKYDFINDEGYDNWPFMSLHHWGENPYGEWVLKISFKSSSGYVDVSNIKLDMFGTDSTPPAVHNIPSKCDITCDRSCSGPGSDGCDVCKDFRVVSTLACVNTCPNGTYPYKNAYCTNHLIVVPNVPKGSIILQAVVGAVVSLVVLICLTIIVLSISVAIACRRKKKERAQRTRYQILHSDDDSLAVPV